MELEFRHLRAICAIAEAGSVSKAATRLGVSQPALSALLQRVERSVGGQLFVRDRSGARPTPLGERALQRARLALADLDAFGSSITSEGSGEPSRLRMGSAHLACVGSVLEQLDVLLPEAEVSLQVEPSALTLGHALANDWLDIAIVGMMEDHQVPLAPELAQRTLVPRIPVFVALAASHELARSDTVSLGDLAEEGWISPPGPDDGSLASLRAACRRAGFSPRIRYDAPSGGRELIESGHAVRLVEPGARPQTAVAIRPLTGEPLHMRLVLAWRRDRLGETKADLIYHAVARAYTTHATRSPIYAPWWTTHPNVHPALGHGG